MSEPILRDLLGAKVAFQLRTLELILGFPAIADTHPKDGDVKQAPLVSGGGAGTAIARKDGA